MVRCFALILVVFFFGCKNSIEVEDLKLLNGYWEIDSVKFTDGETKNYTISTTIDFIEVDGNKGYRKKMQPQLNGTYFTSDDAEEFTIVQAEDMTYLLYGTLTQEWKEVLINVTTNSFSVRNEEGTIYNYKRFEPLNFSQ